VQYAGAIKRAYPKSKIFGPISWGWCGYVYSPADNCGNGPDRKAHGDVPLLEWYIQQLAAYKAKYGVQLVDVIDVHVYPQGANVGTNDESNTTAALRLRSTRELWDPTYVDESWIDTPINLIPRIQEWIKTHYPGLQVAVSEYNWGDDDIITGALAQVMILGIFAENDVYLATRWIAPNSNTKTEEAFRIFTNYDGSGASVKGDNIGAASNNTLEAEAYAFDNNGQLFVIVVNKINSELPVTILVPSIKKGHAKAYSFSRNQPLGPVGSFPFDNAEIELRMAGWSAALIIISD